MRGHELHVVIGAGIAGCTAAIMRQLAGYKVILLEKARSSDPQIYPICTETSTVVSENHSGAEYPYDSQSTRDCLDGRIANERFFPDFIYAGKTPTRILASLSMIESGDDIRERCRESLRVITAHYAQRVKENNHNCVFGNPNTICTEIHEFEGVNDVAAAFITPQRGLNPVYVAALLEAEIKRLGIEFRQGCEVTTIERQMDGSMTVHYVDQWKHQETLRADQVCIATARYGFSLSKKLQPNVNFPEIYFALRQLSFVNLPQGCRKTYTCLKLEDKYGGMFSPLNQQCAMIYHPPAAHIEVAMIDPESGEMPASLLQKLHDGHAELELRNRETLNTLKAFYPELKHAEILTSHLKIAINTVEISRMRRNVPVTEVIPGCTMIILPKWTMAVINARNDLNFALNFSIQRGTLPESHKKLLFQRATEHTIPVPESWKDNFSSFLRIALQHARNMQLPEVIIQPMNIDAIYSLSV